MADQPTFADLYYEHKRHKTRRERFLEQLDSLVPWERLQERIRPHYPKAGRGRRPYALSVMLRVHVVQVTHNLSDPAMEDLLYEAESVRRFVGLRLSEAIPDESTIPYGRLRAGSALPPPFGEARVGTGAVRGDQRLPFDRLRAGSPRC